MRRRELLTLLIAMGGCPPLIARAQQADSPKRIGFFGPGISKPSMMVPNYQAFMAQLRSLGLAEGRNLTVTYGETEDPRGLQAVAADLVQSNPDLIVVSGTEAMLRAVLSQSRYSDCIDRHQL